MVKLPYFIVFSVTIPIYETEEDDGDVNHGPGSSSSSSNGDDHDSSDSSNEDDKTWSQHLHVIQVTLKRIFGLAYLQIKVLFVAQNTGNRSFVLHNES